MYYNIQRLGGVIISKFIGDKKFYKTVSLVVIPIILQMFITQLVGLIDNLMIGQVGSSEMTGVSLGNQLLFIFNLGVFGCMSGASIFACQYFGARDKEGYQETFKYKWFLGIVLFLLSTIVFVLFDDQLINMFINSSDAESTDPLLTLASSKKYLMIMIFGNLPFIVKEIYGTSLREMKETFVPMLSGIVAIFINLFFNYLLIFGKLGFPELGVEGAAIATVLSRFVEMFIVIIYSYVKIHKYNYFKGAYKKLLKVKSIIQFTPRTMVIIINEIFWSLGLTLILACYSNRGLDVVASLNISNTVSNLFWTIGTSFGNAANIILGAKLGENDTKGAKEYSYKIMFFALLVSLVFTVIMIISALFIPNIYNVSTDIKEMSKILIILTALFVPLNTVLSCIYFTIKSGGKVLITFLFDSFYVMAVKLPFAYLLVSLTSWPITVILPLVYLIDILKLVPGYLLVDKGIWIKVIV